MEQNTKKLAIATSETDIRAFVENNTPFDIEELTKFNCCYAEHQGLKLLTDAIRRTRSVEQLTFDRLWLQSRKFCGQIIKALAINTSIKTLSFFGTYADVDIRSWMPMLADNKTLENIEIRFSKLTFESMAQFLNGLKLNSTVTSLKFQEAGLNDDKLQLLAEMLLVNCGLTSLDLCMREVRRGVAVLAGALQANGFVRKVTLSHVATENYTKHIIDIASVPNISYLKLNSFVHSQSERWIPFLESLCTNKTLATLKIEHCPLDIDCCRALAQVLEVNTTLTELKIPRCKLDDDDCADILQALKINATLTKLSLEGNFINSAAISEVLMVNTTLKSLNLTNCTDLDPQLEDLSDALMINNSLTDLKMIATIRTEGMLNIGQALEYNGSLRRLHLELPLRFDKQRTFFSEFLGSLKHNKSLTELNFRTDKPTQKTDAKLIAHTLRNNKAITSLTVFGMEPNADINRWLKRNRKLQRDWQIATVDSIKFIAERLESFLEIFPLEIWKLIFEKIKLPGIAFNFGELFDSVMKDPQLYFAEPMEIDKNP